MTGARRLLARLRGWPDEAATAAAIKAKGNDAAALPLLDEAIRRFPRTGGFKRDRLRLLLALGRDEEASAEAARLLAGPIDSPALGYELWLQLDELGAAPALVAQAAAAFLARCGKDASSRSWRARYLGRRGETDAALALYAGLTSEFPADDPRHRAASREAAQLVLRRNRQGRDWAIVTHAVAIGAAPEPAWQIEAWGRAAEALDPLSDPPLAAIEMLERALPGVTPYRPENALLMVGNTLGCGGMERILANSFRAMRGSGRFEDVHLALLGFAPGAPSAFYHEASSAGPGDITVLATDGAPGPVTGLLPGPWAPRAEALRMLIAARRPRVVHAWNDLTGLMAATAALLAGAPRVIIHFHHLRPTRLTPPPLLAGAYPACYRRLLARPEVELLFVSDAAARDYAEWWGVPRSERFRTLHNGFFLTPAAHPRDTAAARARLGIAAEGPLIGTVFRFNAVKQPLLWVETAARIAAATPDARFVMVGAGELLVETQARAAAFGLAERFVFPGQVENVPEWLAAMDLFVMTSAVEGLPNGAIEAQFAGVPVVAFDVGGTAETIRAGETGLLAAANDVAALAEAAIGLLANERRRTAMGQAASASAAARFGMERYLADLDAIYS